MRWLILGAGALGGFFGARLLQGGADVTFLVRPRREQQLQREGLVVHTQDGETLQYKVRTAQQGGLDGRYDVVLLACKAYDLASAMDAIAPAVGPGTAILPVLNGIRHIGLLEERFGSATVLGGLTVINAALMPNGAIQQSQMRVNMNYLGELGGEKTPRCEGIADALKGIEAKVVPDITAQMWNKYFGFACNATITTLTRSRAGVIAQSASGAAFVSAVIDECARICAAEGFPAPANIQELTRGLYAQAGSTFGPSILIDMEKGRMTEGEHTIGDLVERANKRGVAVPILTAARCNLQAHEITRTTGASAQ
jgi:2-dehydropantoate 2-reductase